MQPRVVWKEGLFICPQHFQQNDRYFIDEITSRTKELSENSWGFFNIDIDENFLSLGKIVINNISGVMPDGTLFNVSSKTSKLSIDIKVEDSAKYFYLVLPITVHNSDEIQHEGQDEYYTRLKSYNALEISSNNTGEESVVDILVAQHNFKLLLEENTSEGYIKLKVGKIGDVLASGAASLDKNYIPTYLHLNSSNILVSKTNELMTTISYRSEKLANKLSDSNVQAAELGDYLMLQLLNKCQSRIYYYMSQNKVHPSKLFLELASLTGELAVFIKKEKRLLKQFEYSHEFQGDSFEAIFLELNEMLSHVLEQNSISLPIIAKKHGVYISIISDKSMINTSSFIFAVKADMDNSKLKKLLLDNLKMGSVETIRDLVNFHLPGYSLKSLATTPRQIPYKVNHLYFRVDLKDEEREKLAKSGGFAFHMSKELPNVKYTLWAIRSE